MDGKKGKQDRLAGREKWRGMMAAVATYSLRRYPVSCLVLQSFRSAVNHKACSTRHFPFKTFFFLEKFGQKFVQQNIKSNRLIFYFLIWNVSQPYVLGCSGFVQYRSKGNTPNVLPCDDRESKHVHTHTNKSVTSRGSPKGLSVSPLLVCNCSLAFIDLS